MKLAVALQERNDLNKKIAQLNYRLELNAVVQEGEKTGEDPDDLLKEIDACYESLEILIARINKTNCQTITNYNNLTLAELIAKKDVLIQKINSYRSLVSTASNLVTRVSRSEIKIMSNVDVKKIQKIIDKMSKELRLVENTIEETNWQNELI